MTVIKKVRTDFVLKTKILLSEVVCRHFQQVKVNSVHMILCIYLIRPDGCTINNYDDYGLTISIYILVYLFAIMQIIKYAPYTSSHWAANDALSPVALLSLIHLAPTSRGKR